MPVISVGVVVSCQSSTVGKWGHTFSVVSIVAYIASYGAQLKVQSGDVLEEIVVAAQRREQSV